MEEKEILSLAKIITFWWWEVLPNETARIDIKNVGLASANAVAMWMYDNGYQKVRGN